MLKKVKEGFHSKVIKAGISYVIGSIALKGIAFLTTPLFTHLMMPSEYGLYGVYLSYEGILNIVIALGVSNSIRNAAIDYKEVLDSYVSSMLGLITCLFWMLCLLFNCLFLLRFSIFPFSLFVTNLLLLHSYASAVIEIVTISYSVRFQSKKYLRVSFFCAVGNVLFSVLLMLTILNENRFLARVLGQSLTYFTTAMVLFLSKMFSERIFYKAEFWKYGIKFGVPMIVFYLGYTVLSSFDRIMIADICGEAEAGIYSFAYNITNILNVIVNAIFTAWTPWFYEKMAVGEITDIMVNRKRICIAVTIVAISLILISPELIYFMAPVSYGESKKFIGILIVGILMIAYYNFYAYTELFYKKAIYLTIGTWIAAALNIFLNVIFIRLFGYYAAAYTTFFSYLILLLVHRKIVIFKYGKELVSDSIFEFFLIGMGILGAVLSVVFSEQWSIRWGILACTFIFLATICKQRIKLSGE